jgi:hypothetical protein
MKLYPIQISNKWLHTVLLEDTFTQISLFYLTCMLFNIIHINFIKSSGLSKHLHTLIHNTITKVAVEHIVYSTSEVCHSPYRWGKHVTSSFYLLHCHDIAEKLLNWHLATLVHSLDMKTGLICNWFSDFSIIAPVNFCSCCTRSTCRVGFL